MTDLNKSTKKRDINLKCRQKETNVIDYFVFNTNTTLPLERSGT
jgi:hypothetical protein